MKTTLSTILILILTFFLERLYFIKNENAKEIVYDKITLIKPEFRTELLADLNERTGLKIHRVDVVSIDYLKDVALLKAYFYAKDSENLLPTTVDND